MSTEIEQVARAICGAKGLNPDHRSPLPYSGEGPRELNEPQWTSWIEAAHAALRTMKSRVRPEQAEQISVLAPVEGLEDEYEWLTGKPACEYLGIAVE